MGKATSPRPRSRKIRPDHFDHVRQNTHILYRCFNRKKHLLYVGITNHPEKRFEHHRVNKVWWKYVDHITMTSYPNRKALAEAEAAAIQHEKPKFNIVQPCGLPLYVNPTRRSVPLWSEPSTFGVVVPDGGGYLIGQSIEAQLYPCLECQARAIYCEDDIVGCHVCAAQWPFDEWFSRVFGNAAVGDQMTLM